MNYKRKFSRKEDKLDPQSLAAEVVRERMEALREAVNNAFKLKVDKRIKPKKSKRKKSV